MLAQTPSSLRGALQPQILLAWIKGRRWAFSHSALGDRTCSKSENWSLPEWGGEELPYPPGCWALEGLFPTLASPRLCTAPSKVGRAAKPQQRSWAASAHCPQNPAQTGLNGIITAAPAGKPCCCGTALLHKTLQCRRKKLNVLQAAAVLSWLGFEIDAPQI